MNSSQFTWEKYIGRVGYSLTEVWDHIKNEPKVQFKEVGRCSASNLIVRPRTYGFAVMLEDTETSEQFWLHSYTHEEYMQHLKTDFPDEESDTF